MSLRYFLNTLNDSIPDMPESTAIGMERHHLIYEWAGYGGSAGGGADKTIPSAFIADGSYAADQALGGDDFVNAPWVSCDFEHWPMDQRQCPHTSRGRAGVDDPPPAGVTPSQYFDNRHQTSVDIRGEDGGAGSQINGLYAFYGYGPYSNYVGTMNDCLEPSWTDDQDWVCIASYLKWYNQAGDPEPMWWFIQRMTVQVDEARRVYQGTGPIILHTSPWYMTEDGTIAYIPIDDWEALLSWADTKFDGVSLWYYRETQGSPGGSYQTSWSDPDNQAWYAALQAYMPATPENTSNLLPDQFYTKAILHTHRTDTVTPTSANVYITSNLDTGTTYWAVFDEPSAKTPAEIITPTGAADSGNAPAQLTEDEFTATGLDTEANRYYVWYAHTDSTAAVSGRAFGASASADTSIISSVIGPVIRECISGCIGSSSAGGSVVIATIGAGYMFNLASNSQYLALI